MKLKIGVDAGVRMQGVDGVEELKALDGKKTRCRGSEVREVNLCLEHSMRVILGLFIHSRNSRSE